jgi:hypothetical protein
LRYEAGNFGDAENLTFGGQRAAETRYRFSGFCLPIAAAKTLPGDCVPLRGLFGLAGDFQMLCELKGNHGVACFLK